MRRDVGVDSLLTGRNNLHPLIPTRAALTFTRTAFCFDVTFGMHFTPTHKPSPLPESAIIGCTGQFVCHAGGGEGYL